MIRVVQHSMDCLIEKHYFEDNCKNFTDFYMSFIAEVAYTDSAFSGNKCAEVDSVGRTHMIWISCGVF